MYCANAPATGADHVIAREFFLENHRMDLPKAPACQTCNSEKSLLEHHLTAVLLFGGRHPDAAANLRTMVPRRLQKNRKLYKKLLQGLAERTVKHPDAISEQRIALTLPIDSNYFRRLFGLITKGLVWHHWQMVLGSNASVRAEAISDSWAPKYGEFFTMKAHEHVIVDLGEGTFSYERRADDLAIFNLRRRLPRGRSQVTANDFNAGSVDNGSKRPPAQT